jgi:hypothetical protein
MEEADRRDTQESLNRTTMDIESILKKLDTTVVDIPADFEVDEFKQKQDDIGENLWQKKKLFDGKVKLK